MVACGNSRPHHHRNFSNNSSRSSSSSHHDHHHHQKPHHTHQPAAFFNFELFRSSKEKKRAAKIHCHVYISSLTLFPKFHVMGAMESCWHRFDVLPPAEASAVTSGYHKRITFVSDATMTAEQDNSSDFPVKVYDDCLNPATTAQVVELIMRRGFTYGWPSNKDIGFAHWNVTFGGYNRLNRKSVESELPELLLDIWKEIQPKYLPNNPVLVRCYANANTFGVEGYPHTDSEIDTDITALVYLNKQWKREWGGETAFFSGHDILYAVMPKTGRLVTFKATLWHVSR